MLSTTTTGISATRLLSRRCPPAKQIHGSVFHPRLLHIDQWRPAGSPPLAFAFDIDGVLLRGEHTIPAAKRALALLEGDNPWRSKIPYILLTNGGGVNERDRSVKLSEQLGRPIKHTQVIQAHTILKKLVSKHRDSAILVLGGKQDVARKVAEDYGYKNVYTTLDILAWNPSIWPFHDLSEEERRSTIKADFSRTPIRAAFVFHDPRNWALDVQVLCDIIQSHGVVGGPYQQGPSPVELVFCNPDLIWRSDFERPRLGQGAFKEAFQAVHKGLTGNEYPHVQYGKPTKETYDFAKDVLQDQLESMQGHRHLPSLYMIGDNPESDIAGANAAKWNSVLVHTGVYDPAGGPPTHTPSQQAVDVEAAVRWAIEREYGASN